MSEATTIIQPAKVGANTSPAVAAVRAKMLDGLAPVPIFAEAILKTERTVFSYIAQGMPAEYFGRTPYIVIDQALEWLRSRKRRDHKPPRRGRPRKGA